MIAAAHTPIDYVAAYATTLTAFGTLGLAIATLVLALKTRALAKSGQQTAHAAAQELEILRGQADAAQRQSEVAEAALNASIRPLILDVPRESDRYPRAFGPRDAQPGSDEAPENDFGIGFTPDHHTLVLPVRNVGAGVARMIAATVATEDSLVHGNVPSVIAAGETDFVSFWPVDFMAPEPFALGRTIVYIEVAYSDIAGSQESATRFQLDPSAERFYVVAEVEPDVDRKDTLERWNR